MADVIFVALTIAVFVVLGFVREGGGAAVSAVNAVGLVRGRRPGGLPGRGPAVPGAVLMSTTTAGVIFIASLVVGPGAWCYRPLGDYMYRRLHRHQAHRASSGCIYRLVGVDPDAEQTLGRLRPQRAGVLGWSRSCSSTASSGCRTTCCCRLGFGPVRAARWRGTPRSASSPTPTGSRTRASRPWATWCRWPAWRCRTSSRPRSASRWRSRWSAASPAAAPSSSATSGSTWSAASLRILLPIAVVGAIVLIAGGVVQNLPPAPHVTHADRRHARRSPAARWPARRPSRSSAPTAAASTTPTPPTRSRTRPRWTNWLEIFLMLLIPFSLPRTFGRMVGAQPAGLRDRRA